MSVEKDSDNFFILFIAEIGTNDEFLQNLIPEWYV